jgi:hypothetical protein
MEVLSAKDDSRRDKDELVGIVRYSKDSITSG